MTGRSRAIAGNEQWQWHPRLRVWRALGSGAEIQPVKVPVGRRHVSVLWKLSTTREVFETYQEAMLTAAYPPRPRRSRK